MLFVFINSFVFFAIFASYSYWILASNLLVRMKKMKQMIVICMQHKHFDTDIHSFRCDINHFIYNLFSILTLIQTADTLHFASSLFLYSFSQLITISNHIVHPMQWTKWWRKKTILFKYRWTRGAKNGVMIIIKVTIFKIIMMMKTTRRGKEEEEEYVNSNSTHTSTVVLWTINLYELKK